MLRFLLCYTQHWGNCTQYKSQFDDFDLNTASTMLDGGHSNFKILKGQNASLYMLLPNLLKLAC